jgi:hypothetical protein
MSYSKHVAFIIEAIRENGVLFSDIKSSPRMKDFIFTKRSDSYTFKVSWPGNSSMSPSSVSSPPDTIQYYPGCNLIETALIVDNKVIYNDNLSYYSNLTRFEAQDGLIEELIRMRDLAGSKSISDFCDGNENREDDDNREFYESIEKRKEEIKNELREEIKNELREEIKNELREEIKNELRKRPYPLMK